MKHYFLLFILIQLIVTLPVRSQYTIRLGIIGLDTSHSTAFVELINGKNPQPEFEGFKVVAAFPYGSRNIESSAKRIPEYTETVKKYGVKISSSIANMLKEVDCVFLETNDGTLHLEQATEVIKSGKTLFIDKPIAATLHDVLTIYQLAEKYNVPIYSSSALRFSPKNQELRAGVGTEGKVIGADCYSICKNEANHAGFYWYGIHGVEILFTIMKQGCTSVSCISTESTDVAVGVWKDGRIGTYRGIREGVQTYGGTAICEKQVVAAGGYTGYTDLLKSILTFFKTKVPPVDKAETIEIYTFMEAANESIRQRGKPVSMEETYTKALKAVKK